MENWLFLLLGLILGIPLSIFANYATPYVISYFKDSSLSRRERRLYILRSRYQFIKKAKENPNFFYLIVFRQITWGLIFIAVTTANVGLGTFSILLRLPSSETFYKVGATVMVFGVLIIVYFLHQTIQDINDILKFDKYKEKTIKKLITLGCKPEDLDKEFIDEEEAA